MHHAKTIPLTFNRKDFEEIYFKDNNGSFFFGSTIKRDLVALVVSLLFLIGSIVYSLKSNKSAGWILFLSILTFAFLLRYIVKAVKISAWRKSISAFLDNVEKVNSHKIIITDSAFCLVQDGKESIHKWTTFTHAEINDDYLLLTGPVQYFIPKKSILKEDYDFLIKEVRARIQNGL